jgi:Domain of unknown function (DUF3783)
MLSCEFVIALVLCSQHNVHVAYKLATCALLQLMEVIAAYKEAMLPPTVFAGAVPNNWEAPLAYLIEELYKDATAAAERARLAAETYQ